MGLFDEQNDGEREPEKNSSGNYLSLIIFACTLPVLWYFSHIGKTDLGLSIGICLAMNVVAVGMCWDLRRHWWFWVVIVLVLTLHIPVVLMIPWPNVWVSKFTLLPIGLTDLVVTVGVVRLVQKFIVKSASPEEEG